MWQDDEDAKNIVKSQTDLTTYCQDLTLAGYSDWHLPSIRELTSIVDRGRDSAPLIDPVFTNVSVYYWTSTNPPDASSASYRIDFSKGTEPVGSKRLPSHVRCVRVLSN